MTVLGYWEQRNTHIIDSSLMKTVIDTAMFSNIYTSECSTDATRDILMYVVRAGRATRADDSTCVMHAAPIKPALMQYLHT